MAENPPIRPQRGMVRNNRETIVSIYQLLYVDNIINFFVALFLLRVDC